MNKSSHFHSSVIAIKKFVKFVNLQKKACNNFSDVCSSKMVKLFQFKNLQIKCGDFFRIINMNLNTKSQFSSSKNDLVIEVSTKEDTTSSDYLQVILQSNCLKF